MALKATIYKADIQIADMDRHYYGDHTLTIARHPSETDERMMVRLFAFVLHAHEALAFGKGLSTEDEPDLWQRDLTGAIERWIDVGLPDEKRLLKACGRAEEVRVYSYSANSGIWWKQIGDKLARAKNLYVANIAPDASLALSKLAARTMKLNCSIQEGQVWFSDAQNSVQLEPVTWKNFAT